MSRRFTFRSNSYLKFLLLAAFVLCNFFAFAQTKLKVTGIIVDQDNAVLPGVTISIKGKTIGATSDRNGSFTIEASSGDVLTFTMVGYQPQSSSVSQNNLALKIQMNAKSSALNEVVVIGYGSSRKKDLTGAVSSVDVKKADELPVTSVDQILAGKTSGVQINQSSGQAGAAASIRIRGGNSINGTNEPLFVIDGFPIINDSYAYAAGGPLGLTNAASGNPGQGNPDNPLNWLNPADIQSVEILKDASATAIYGSRGANGVIIITTKKGKAGQSNINFSASTGFSQLDLSRIKLMTGPQYATYLNLENAAEGKTVFYKDTTINGIFYPVPSKLGTTNWMDAISRKGPTQNYSLSMSGGRDVVYSLSGAYTDQKTPLIGSDFKRGTFRLNLQTDVTNWLKLDNSTNYSSSITDNSPNDTRDIQKFGLFEDAILANPAAPVRNPDGSLAFTPGDPSNNNTPNNNFNPIALGTDILNRNSVQTFVDNLSLKAKITSFLSFEARGSVFTTDLLRDIYYNSKTTFNGFEVGGLAGKNSNDNQTYLTEEFLTFNKTFGKNVVNGVLGYSYQQSNDRTINSGASGFPNDILLNENLAAGATQYPTQTNRLQDLLASQYVRLNDVYDNKYLITFTARRDGSSKFGANNKYAFFPSGALGWNINEEDFLKNSKSISALKLRVSYGESGNQAIASLQSQTLLGFNNYPEGGTLQTGVYPSILGNPNLKWETTKEFNLGLDFGFFDQRFSGSVNYYIKHTDNLLQQEIIPEDTGFGSIYANVGSIQNKGFELDLHAGVVRSSGFHWDIEANIAHNNQILTSLGLPGVTKLIEGGGVALIQGQPIGAFYGYVYDGIYNSQAQLTALPGIPGSKIGSIRFKDLNGDGLINDQDQQIIGNPNPKFTYGFTNSFSYKGFDLIVVFQGSYGAQILDLTDYTYGRLGSRIEAANDYYTPSNPNAKYPAPGDQIGATNISSFYVQSGSYLRLKSLNFGYNIPVQKIKAIKNLRVFASGTNLLTFTPYKGFDPEVNSYGQSNLYRNIDIASVPLYRTYIIGITGSF